MTNSYLTKFTQEKLEQKTWFVHVKIQRLYNKKNMSLYFFKRDYLILTQY